MKLMLSKHTQMYSNCFYHRMKIKTASSVLCVPRSPLFHTPCYVTLGWFYYCISTKKTCLKKGDFDSEGVVGSVADACKHGLDHAGYHPYQLVVPTVLDVARTHGMRLTTPCLSICQNGGIVTYIIFKIS